MKDMDTDRLTSILGVAAIVFDGLHEVSVLPTFTGTLAAVCGASWALLTNKLPKPSLKSYRSIDR